jgi:hypothetical protein
MQTTKTCDSRGFNVGFTQVIHAIRNNNVDSEYSNRTSDTGHRRTYGNIAGTMEIIKVAKKETI